MENEIQTWGYWLLGFLQVVVVISTLRVGRLINTCHNAHNWAQQTKSVHFDVPAFSERIEQIYENSRSLPLEALLAFVVNCVMLYSISTGDVHILVQIIAASVNATMIVSYFAANKTITEIIGFVSQVEALNAAQQDVEKANAAMEKYEDELNEIMEKMIETYEDEDNEDEK